MAESFLATGAARSRSADRNQVIVHVNEEALRSREEAAPRNRLRGSRTPGRSRSRPRADSAATPPWSRCGSGLGEPLSVGRSRRTVSAMPFAAHSRLATVVAPSRHARTSSTSMRTTSTTGPTAVRHRSRTWSCSAVATIACSTRAATASSRSRRSRTKITATKAAGSRPALHHPARDRDRARSPGSAEPPLEDLRDQRGGRNLALRGCARRPLSRSAIGHVDDDRRLVRHEERGRGCPGRASDPRHKVRRPSDRAPCALVPRDVDQRRSGEKQLSALVRVRPMRGAIAGG